MDENITNIIISAISVIVPALTTIFTTRGIRKQANKHSSRTNILQLIADDHLRVLEGGLPENYQAILDSFDEYRKSGGNSYCHDKVEEYKKWYETIKPKSRKVNKKGE